MRTRRSIYKSPPQSKKKESTEELEDKENFIIDSTPSEIVKSNDEESSSESEMKEAKESDDEESSPENEMKEAKETDNEESSSSDEEEEQKSVLSFDDNQKDSSESESEEPTNFIISNEPSKEIHPESDYSENEESVSKKQNKKRRKKEIPASKAGRKYPKYNKEIEQSLEKFLFGKISSIDNEESSDEEEEPKKVTKQWSVINKDSESDSDSESESAKTQMKAAWHDEDDDLLQVKDITATYAKAKGKHGKKETSTDNYALSLRKQFTNLMDRPKWADLQAAFQDEDSDDEFFRQTTDTLNTGKTLALKKGRIEVRKCQDINYTTHNEGSVIKCAEFHPKNAIGLVAGLNGTASLFQIDGKTNPKLKSVHFENFPIKTAHFSNTGNTFYAGSQHFGHFYAYDMIKDVSIKVPWKEAQEKQFSMQKFQVNPVNDLIAFQGRFGAIHLFSGRSRSKLFSLQMNDHLHALTFSPDGEYLYSSGVGGQVYIWDLKAQECIHKFVDDGCITGTALAVSSNNRFLATGSKSGVVNVYQRSHLWNSTNPKPEKIVMNLTTAVSEIKFNPSSEILAMASDVKDNAVKLLHLPSMTVFSNFPSFNHNFHRANCMDFSLNGGYFSIGNNRGAANLYKFKHYGTY